MVAMASLCDLKCVLENYWKRLAVSFLNLIPINESIIRRFVANSSRIMDVYKAFVANCSRLRNYNIFKLLIISSLKTKRSSKHRAACYPLATPFRSPQANKNFIQSGSKTNCHFKEMNFQYVVFR
jgi:hypothetical protein